MRKNVLMVLISLLAFFAKAQTNTFPTSGSVGIGTLSPAANLEIKSPGNEASLMIRHQNQQGDGLAGLILAQRPNLSAIVECNGCELAISSGWDKNLIIGSSAYNTYGGKVLIPGGYVGIGTANPTEKLSVNGKIRAKEVKVETANWPDYVFDQDYKVLGLQELDTYIKANKHLPEMPSAKEVEANGMALGEIVKLQQKKIEELTLHLIAKEKEILKLNNAVSKLPEIEKQLKKLLENQSINK